MGALAIVGTGLVTPLARTPAQHAFFVRAEVGPPAPGAFLDTNGEPIPVAYCPWLDVRLGIAERLRALAARAFADARAPLLRGERRAKIPLGVLAISGEPRAGLDAADRKALEAMLAPASEHLVARRFTGDAGVFAALLHAESLVTSGDVRAVAIVAADSFVSRAYLSEELRAAPSWEGSAPRPAEGAAVLIVTTTKIAHEEGLEILATIHFAATRQGEARDDDDAVIDGSAMTALLRSAADASRPAGACFGQHGVGELRQRTWDIATARCPEAIDETCALVSLETSVGRLGAAAGAAALAYGVAVARHDVWPIDEGPRPASPILAWAISPDGLSGLCTATVST